MKCTVYAQYSYSVSPYSYLGNETKGSKCFTIVSLCVCPNLFHTFLASFFFFSVTVCSGTTLTVKHQMNVINWNLRRSRSYFFYSNNIISIWNDINSCFKSINAGTRGIFSFTCCKQWVLVCPFFSVMGWIPALFAQKRHCMLHRKWLYPL